MNDLERILVFLAGIYLAWRFPILGDITITLALASVLFLFLYLAVFFARAWLSRWLRRH